MMHLRTLITTMILATSIVALRETSDKQICYSREEIDNHTVIVEKVPCDEQQHEVFKIFASRSYFSITDLMGEIRPRCDFDDLHKIANGQFKVSDCDGSGINNTCSLSCEYGYFSSSDVQTTCQDKGNNNGFWSPGNYSCEVITCSFDKLPNVTHGSIKQSNCSGNFKDDVCNMSCEDGFYPNSPNFTICEDGGIKGGRWSEESYSCYAVNCSFMSLPDVTNGIFDISDCSGNNEGDVCKMKCKEHYYPNSSEQTICENNGNNEGRWSNQEFSCHRVVCSFFNLPDVDNGIFYPSDCSGNYEDDMCNMTCREHYSPNSLEQTICQNNGNNKGRWSNKDLSCVAKCSTCWTDGTYTSVNIKMTWNNSEDFCRSLSSHLVYVDDAEENTLVQTILTNTGLSSYIFIGLIRGNNANEWIWLDKTVASYTNWLAGQIEDYEGCVAIYEDGLWHDLPCSSMQYFMCEK